MPLMCYRPTNFQAKTLAVIDQANAIIREYDEQGFDLTLRQLYYQFVARDLLANRQTEYNRLGEIVSAARLAGYIDWSSIVDRTRNVRENPHWESPADMMRACVEQYNEDRWAGQDVRLEVWIEKDALLGVIEDVCRRNDVRFFSCRGYVSQSEMWVAACRLRGYADDNDEVPAVVLHLGDHDPSGVDMTRDIRDRLALLACRPIEVVRLALNRDQVDAYKPPPNPAKVTDSRAAGYIAEHGHDSWELDALDPPTLNALLEAAIDARRDKATWDARAAQVEERRNILADFAEELTKRERR